MRYTVFLIGLLIILFSCKSTFILSDVSEKNIQNEPTSYVSDSAIVMLVAPYKQSLKEDMSRVIAISKADMVKAKPESNLTNFLADLLMEEGDTYCKTNNKSFSPDMAFVNYGGIRSSLPKGNITVENIFELMPFENVLVLLKISGETMQQFIERIAERGGDGIAGIKLGIKNGTVGKLTIGGKPFNKKQDYWLVTNDYIAAGGDDMKMLTDRKEYINTGLKIRDLIINNLSEDYRAGKTIQEQLDGRFYNE